MVYSISFVRASFVRLVHMVHYTRACADRNAKLAYMLPLCSEPSASSRRWRVALAHTRRLVNHSGHAPARKPWPQNFWDQNSHGEWTEGLWRRSAFLLSSLLFSLLSTHPSIPPFFFVPAASSTETRRLGLASAQSPPGWGPRSSDAWHDHGFSGTLACEHTGGQR